jgi:hypothetical protein
MGTAGSENSQPFFFEASGKDKVKVAVDVGFSTNHLGSLY